MKIGVKQKVIEANSVGGSLEFLNNYYQKYDFVIVSGSDQEELREVCKARGIDHFFCEILGSPVAKELNIANLLLKKGWKKNDCLLIGDSVNDLHAAESNSIDFIGRNSGLVNWRLADNVSYIDDLFKLHLCLQ